VDTLTISVGATIVYVLIMAVIWRVPKRRR